MAHTKPLLYVCRACRQNVQKAPLLTRSFNSTAQYQKSIPSFTPTTIPALDEIFLDYRERVFTPAALGERHRHMISSPRHHETLINDPGITVTLSDGEELRLRPQHDFDRPNKKKSLTQVSQILGETTDSTAWNNLIPFLEGMKNAKATPRSFYEKITRKAVEQGKAGIIVTCAEQSSKTGLKLTIPQVTWDLMLGCHDKAAEAKFQGPGFLQAAKQANTIAKLLAKQDHCAGRLEEGEVDMRRNLGVMGVLLEMAAAKAVNVDGGKDVDGRVADYVEKTLLMSEKGLNDPANVSLEQQGQSQSGRNEKQRKVQEAAAQRRRFQQLLPLWNGMKLATKVEGLAGGKLGASLKSRLQALDKQVQQLLVQVKASNDGKPRRAESMYDALQ